MDKAQVEQIAEFLVDVREGLCEGDDEATLGLFLAQLRRVIQGLMEASLADPDLGENVPLASLKYEVRLCRQEIERRLAAGN